jgi:hypothetical protein
LENLFTQNMNAKHPIDELFARGLSDAEATPPPAVWEGIVRQRGWGHRTLLQLQRRWGLLAGLLLLVGGSVAGWHYSTSPTPAQIAATHTSASTTQPVTSAAEVAATTTTSQELEANTAATSQHDEVAAPTTHTATQEQNDLVQADHPKPNTPSPSSIQATAPESIAEARTPSSSPSKTIAHPIDGPSPNRNVVVTLGAVDETEHASSNTASTTAAAASLNPSSEGTPGNRTAGQPVLATSEVYVPERTTPTTGLNSGAPMWLPARTINVGPMLITAAALQSGTLVPYKKPKASWNVGITGGFYSEERTWKGKDLELVNALNGTETPHYPYSVGLALGRDWHSGFNMVLGLEYAVARFDLTRTERTQEWTQQNTPGFIVLLDTMIVAYSDDTTYLTLTEHVRETSTRNTVTSFRIPLEVGYGIDWRRWTFGMRVGPVAEFIRSRSGLTLDLHNSDNTTYAVQVDKERANTIISASLSPYIGFRLSERMQIAAEGVYMRGLGELGGSDAYVLPDRIGARLHLSYTLPHKR